MDFCDFGLGDTFQKRTALKPVEIDMEKLRMKFFSIERRFQQYKSRFSRFKKTCARGHQRAAHGTLVKVVILPLLASFS